MKKLICLVSVLALLFCCMTACSFNSTVSGVGEAQSESKVEEMLSAISEKNASEAKSLMHPKRTAYADGGIAQMVGLMAGRTVSSLERLSISVSSSSGTAGKTRQEKLSYKVTLGDGTVFAISTTYLSDADGEGFTSFQFVMGVI